MKTPDEKLERLLMQAREAKPPVEVGELEAMLQHTSPDTPKPSNTKIFLLMTTAVTILLSPCTLAFTAGCIYSTHKQRKNSSL